MSKRLWPIAQLGYVGFDATDLDEWKRFATGLGMQVAENGSTEIRLRMDERPYRLFARKSAANGLACIGLELTGTDALDDVLRALGRGATSVQSASPDECRARDVGFMAFLTDPDGNRIELFCGPGQASTGFVASGTVSGFRTGELGLGHIVLQTPRLKAMKDFYLALGFRTSDYMDAPFEAHFMHTNARHHSLALLQAPEAKIHHVMVEYLHLDDIGRLYDAAQAEPDRIVSTLGRHSNDHMLSFYTRTPGGFMIETGWAGRLIDADRWEQERIVTPSLWGHERKWLPEAARKAIRLEMNNQAALGVRAPVEVVDSPAFNISGLVSNKQTGPSC